MKKNHMSYFRIGMVLLLAAAALSACASGAPAPTGAAATEKAPYPPYPAYATNEPSTAYPEPQETAAPDSPATSPAYPPAGTPSGDIPQPNAPQPGDAGLQRGEAFLEPDQINLMTLESFPPRYNLILVGALPTPCHELRVEVSPPNERSEIIVSVYSVVDPGKICTQVLQSFNTIVPLRNLPSGTYMVKIHDGPTVGEITVP